MKYKFLSFLLSMVVGSMAFANEPVEKYPRYRGYYSFETWFASANAGAQVFMGDHDKQENFGKRITPTISVSVGKWLNPSFGVRGSINGGQIVGLTQTKALASSDKMIIDAPHYLYRQKFNYIHAHADLMFHWSNDAYDVNLNRTYNLIPYAGIGIMAGLNKQKETKFSPNLGVIQTIRLTDKWDLNLDIMGNIVGDAFDGEKGGNKFEGRVAATVGFTYNFR